MEFGVIVSCTSTVVESWWEGEREGPSLLESPSYNSLMIQLQFAQVGRVWRVQHIIILDDLLKEWGLTLKIKLHVAGDTDADDMAVKWSV